MIRISATPTVAIQLARHPGLRDRVEETLSSIIETATEIRRLGHSGELESGFLRVRVRDFMISYTLDLDAGSATVVFAEKIQGGSGGGSVDAA